MDEAIALRPWTHDDVEALVRACVDPEIQRWTLVPAGYTRAHAERFVEHAAQALADRSSVEVAVVDATSDEVLGSVGLVTIDHERGVAEIGYWTAPHARGRGVATRAVRLLTDFAFAELGLKRLELMPFVGNRASERVAARAGYVREGRRSGYESKAGPTDVVVYSTRARYSREDIDTA